MLLLHRLTSNPYLYTRAAWSGIFCHTLLAAAMAAATCGHSGGSNGEIPHARSAADAPAAGGHAALPLPQPEYLRRQRILLQVGTVQSFCRRSICSTGRRLVSVLACCRGRQTVCLVPQQALQRSLAAQACWMMHLGVCEESAWELVTGLVAAARVADLPVEGERWKVAGGGCFATPRKQLETHGGKGCIHHSLQATPDTRMWGFGNVALGMWHRGCFWSYTDARIVSQQGRHGLITAHTRDSF